MKIIVITIFLVAVHLTAKVKGYENDPRVVKQLRDEQDITYQQGGGIELRDEQDITYQQGGGIVGSACTCLARRLGWKRVIVLFDNAGEPVVQAMMTYWSDTQTQIQVQMICVDSFHSDDSVRNLLGDLYHSVPHLNVILMARFSVVIAIMRQVNDFDCVSNRTTDFGHRSKWIVVSEESVKDNLTTWTKDLENVAFVSTLNMTGCSNRELKILTIVKSSSGPTLTPVCFSNCNVSANDIFPNVKYKYNGRELTVIRTENDPFTSSVFKHGKVTYEGYGIAILDIMAKHLNFTYTITYPEDKQWGLMVNGTWNGIVGMLARREADLQISSLTVHEDRAKVMHFLLPPVQTQVVDVLYRRDERPEDNWLTYVRQFRPAVFLGIGLSAAVFCLLFVVSESCGHEEEQSEERTHCQRWLRVLNRSVLFALASTAKQSQSIKTRSIASNIMVASWSLFLIVTTTAYTANLVAELTSYKPSVPFRTLGELVDNKDFTFGIHGNGIISSIFKKSRSGDIKRAWDTLQTRSETDPNILQGDSSYHIQRVLRGQYGWIIAKEHAKVVRMANCSAVFMNSPFNWQHIAFGVPIASPYINDFEHILSVLNDNGFLAKLRKKWFKTACDIEGHESQTARIMGMDDVKGVFVFSAAGIGLAVVVLILEVVYLIGRAKHD